MQAFLYTNGPRQFVRGELTVAENGKAQFSERTAAAALPPHRVKGTTHSL